MNHNYNKSAKQVMKEISMEYEEWRVIPNSEDKYFASNYGRIFSVR